MAKTPQPPQMEETGEPQPDFTVFGIGSRIH